MDCGSALINRHLASLAMEPAEFIILLICLFLIGILLVVAVVIYITPNSDPKRKKLNGEESYHDPLKGLARVWIPHKV